MYFSHFFSMERKNEHEGRYRQTATNNEKNLLFGRDFTLTKTWKKIVTRNVISSDPTTPPPQRHYSQKNLISSRQQSNPFHFFVWNWILKISPASDCLISIIQISASFAATLKIGRKKIEIKNANLNRVLTTSGALVETWTNWKNEWCSLQHLYRCLQAAREGVSKP